MTKREELMKRIKGYSMWPPKEKIEQMTDEEFEKRYCENSGITIDEYHGALNLITLPCNCDADNCEGWAAIDNTPQAIKTHKTLYTVTPS